MKTGKHIRYVANGQGAQSILLCVQSGEGKFPCDVWIAADTGEEKNRTLNTGEQITAKQYFKEVTYPLSKIYGIPAYFVRSLTKDKQRLPPIMEYTEGVQIARGRPNATNMPLFVEGAGRLKQSCTDRWKVIAMKQKLRRLGASTAHSYQGIHYDEAWRRVKGIYLRDETFVDFTMSVYQSTDGTEELSDEAFQRAAKRHVSLQTVAVQTRPADLFGGGIVWKVPTCIWWMTHSYPLADQKIGREQAREEVEKRKIPYLVSSECDCCPHQDLARWLRLGEERLSEVAAFEDRLNSCGLNVRDGRKVYFTSLRIPLREAIEEMKRKAITAGRDPFEEAEQFGCGNNYNACFV